MNPPVKNISKTIHSSREALSDYLNRTRENRKLAKSIEISVSILVVALFALLAIRPAVTTVSGLIGEIKNKEKAVKDLQKKIADISSAQDEFSMIQERFLVVESALPSGPYFSQAANQIIHILNNQNLAIENLPLVANDISSKQEETINKNLLNLNSSLNLQGDYGQLIKTLSEIANNRRLTKIDSILISQGEDNKNKNSPTSPGLLNFSLNLSQYYWPLQ
jgi:Tfp pilus assembly protein PilO